MKIQNIKNILFIFITTLLLSPFFSITHVGAEEAATTKTSIINNMKKLGTGAGYNSSTNQDSLINTIASFVAIILGFLGVVFMILVIISGIQWMTAGGNDDKVKNAKTRMKNATIGLVVVLMSYSIMTFVKLIIYAAQ